MYHIKPDKRSQTSARLITEGLYCCLEEKKYTGITISDIQRSSGVGRATFYRLFDNLTDVLMYECDNVFRQMLDKYRARAEEDGQSSFESLFIYFMEYFSGHSSLLDALTDSNRTDILRAVFYAHTGEIKAILVPDTNLTKRQVDYFVSVATSAIFGVFETWSAGGKKESPEDLIDLLKCSIDIVETSLTH